MTSTITVQAPSGPRQQAAYIVGQFGCVKSYRGPKRIPDGWLIIHVPTGLMVEAANKLDTAKEFAARCDACCATIAASKEQAAAYLAPHIHSIRADVLGW